MNLLEKLNQQIIDKELKEAKEKYELTIKRIKENTKYSSLEELFEDNFDLFEKNKEYVFQFSQYIVKTKTKNSDGFSFYFDTKNISKEEYFEKVKNLKITLLEFEVNDFDDEYTFKIKYKEQDNSDVMHKIVFNASYDE